MNRWKCFSPSIAQWLERPVACVSVSLYLVTTVSEKSENTLTLRTSPFLQNAVLSLGPWRAICGDSNFCFHTKFLFHVALLKLSRQVKWICPMILSPSILGVLVTSSDVPREFWSLRTTWLRHGKAVRTQWPSQRNANFGIWKSQNDSCFQVSEGSYSGIWVDFGQ